MQSSSPITFIENLMSPKKEVRESAEKELNTLISLPVTD